MKKNFQSDFNLLSLREENQLSKEDLITYYEKLRTYAVSRKLTNTTPGALTVAPKLKKYVNKLDSFLTRKLAGEGVECVTDGIENIPDGPCIFASTHQGLLDNFCWIPSNPKHCILLHASDTSKFLIFVQYVIGLILVDKNYDNINSKYNSKLDMIKILLKGHSIFWCPEGAWNLSPNKLHLPMRYGIIDVARKSNAPIIPMVTEFTYDTSSEKEIITKIHIRYGNPIYVSLEDDALCKFEEYKEAISTIRWDLISEKGIFKRSKITNWDYINYMKGILKNLGMKDPKLGGKKMLEIENKSIFGSDDEFYKFHYINDIPFDENGEFLETEEVEKLNKIFERECGKQYD